VFKDAEMISPASRMFNGFDGGRTTRERSMSLKGKKVIALGERDGIQGTAIAECAKSAGAEVVLEMTHCFV
jgi:betaine reductase